MNERINKMSKIIIFLFAFVLLVNAIPRHSDEISKEFNASIFDEEFFNEFKSPHNFTDKVVLVSGSSSGLGRAIVCLFSYLGAKVVVHGNTPSHVRDTAKLAQRFSPEKLEPLEVLADVTKSCDLKRLINETIKTFGKLDILVNNVGIETRVSIHDKDFMKIYDNINNIVLRSYVELAYLSIPYLIKTKGSIVQTASIGGIAVPFHSLPYSICKAAIIMMTKNLALELGPLGIRVNTVSPGIIKTPLFHSAVTDSKLNQWINHTPLSRIGMPLDIAKAVLFLSSNDAAFITGHNLVVDGGLLHNFNSELMKMGVI